MDNQMNVSSGISTETVAVNKDVWEAHRTLVSDLDYFLASTTNPTSVINILLMHWLPSVGDSIQTKESVNYRRLATALELVSLLSNLNSQIKMIEYYQEESQKEEVSRG